MRTSDKMIPAPGNKNAARKSRAAFFLRSLIAIVAVASALFCYTAIRLNVRAVPVGAEEAAAARSVYEKAHWASIHPFDDARDLSPLAWDDAGARTYPSADAIAADLNARSVILVDATTGSILFERNADELIPPASMTKLVAMYTAFRAIKAGEISLDDELEPPPESWASNIPAGSSLMFLGEGQRVTVRELLLGMAVVSGNDAAIALACHVSGSVAAFVERMNAEMETLSLRHTRFVEPSGLSELNQTTAREFANFALSYIREYPEALKQFHSQPRLAYPASQNLPAWSTERPVEQEATNRLVGALEGCDGLKTGFIRESGFNLSLTAERNGNRFISVTMRGPGSNSYEGSLLRSKDGILLMEWAFANFRTARPEPARATTVTVWKGEFSAIEAIPAGQSDFTIPESAIGAAGAAITYDIPRAIRAPVHAGDLLGSVRYSINGTVVHSVPLVADRTVHTSGFFRRALDHAAQLLAARVFALR